MAIITISRGSYSRGKEVAEKVAKTLNYTCISRDILLEASEQFHIPEIKLVRAIHDAPRVLERFSHGKQRYISFIQSAMLSHLQKDNVVYHGLAGHFFVQGISHAIKVRIIADLEARVREEMARENISEDEARYILRKDDEERRRWGLALYGKDTWDCSLYDLVISTQNQSVDNAVELIVQSTKFPCFQTTSESRQKIRNMALAAEVKTVLVRRFPDVETFIENGDQLHVKVEAPLIHEKEINREIQELAQTVRGVKDLRVHLIPYPLDGD